MSGETSIIPEWWYKGQEAEVILWNVYRSNFFAMPPTATKPGAPGAANPEVPKFNFGFGAAKK